MTEFHRFACDANAREPVLNRAGFRDVSGIDAPADLALVRPPAVSAHRRMLRNSRSVSSAPGHDFREQLLQVSRIATGAVDWDETLSEIAMASVGIIGADRCIVLLWDPHSNELEAGADRGLVKPRASLETGARFALDRWPAARSAILERIVKRVKPTDWAANAYPVDAICPPETGGALLAPLWVGGECLGLIALCRAGSAEFTPAELDVCRDLASQVAPALQNARLLATSRRHAAEQAALFRVSQAAVSMHDQQTVMREIARAALSVLHCESCAIELWHREHDELEVIARESVLGWPALDRESGRYSLGEFPNMRFVLEQQTPMQLHPEQTQLTEIETMLLTRSSIQSQLIVPMVVAGDSLGVITLSSRRSRAFDSNAFNFAQEIAAQTALVIQNSNFVARTRRQTDEQTTLLRVSQAVISGKNLREVLAEIARVGLGFGGVEGCRIVIWHQATEAVELAAEENVPEWLTYYQLGEHYPAADWPSYRQAMVTGQPRGFLVADADVTARERANHIADGINSVFAIPIMGGSECLGCLAFHSRDSRRFHADTVRMGRELAAQAAHAIDRARLFGQLQARAETDGLTGLLNHRAAFETLDRELAYARNNTVPVGVIVLDLDDFKLFNDTHGHLIGDRVLVEVAAVLKDTVRPRDHVARYGGDEFLLILPNANESSSAVIAERLVKRMEQATVNIGDMHLPIRFSVGVASFPKDAKSRQELIAFADSSMYAAKELGGGQVGSIERGTRSLEVSTIGALAGLVRAVDRKDRYTKDHSDLVAEYAVRFAKSLRLAPQKIEATDLAGKLHDVGKIAVPDSILRKPGHLTPDEEAMIRQHVVFSELMIKGVPHLDDVLAAVGHHHERWDGGGYPYGKSGTQIPLLGRILALSDALAAMTHDRPYRKGLSLQQAVEEVRAGAGTQFDPDLVEPFIAAVTTQTALLRDAARRHEPSQIVRSGPLTALPGVRRHSSVSERLYPVVTVSTAD